MKAMPGQKRGAPNRDRQVVRRNCCARGLKAVYLLPDGYVSPRTLHTGSTWRTSTLREGVADRGSCLKNLLRCFFLAQNLCLFLLFFTSSFQVPRLAAQEEPPLINQPATNFYQAQGSNVKVTWSVEPTTIPEGNELTATLIITGASNPRRIVRPDLKKFPEFQSRFTITDNDDPAPTDSTKEVRFSYRLRPQRRSVEEVPSLKFYYYNPTAAVGKKQFPLTVAAAVPITVTEAPKIEPPVIPLREADHLFVVATGPQLLNKRRFDFGLWPWVVVGLAGPICAIIWFLAWQHVFPDAVRLAKMRRSRAARRAIDAIRRASRGIDPPTIIATAVLSYLHTRFPFPPGAVTPSEIEGALTELKVSVSECAEVAEFFRSCDAARFAPPRDNDVSLVSDAIALITRLESA
jgi:hypothetical protein